MSHFDLRALASFGDVAAEEDAVLEYFLKTAAVARIRESSILVLLGRKGSGKTALVRYFAEEKGALVSRALNLGDYPWGLHATRIDHGAAPVEAYVSSWRFLIALEFALAAYERAPDKKSPDAKAVCKFMEQNYGTVGAQLKEILSPNKLDLKGLTLAPAIHGNTLGSLDFERSGAVRPLGAELNVLSDALLKSARKIAWEAGVQNLQLHFDELDKGLTDITETRKQMLIGLVLAAKAIRQTSATQDVKLTPIIYLRSDIWDDFVFSDKNKITQSTTFTLEWNASTLSALINTRLRVRLGQGATWDSISTDRMMRGSQSKWNHILGRTFLRPRDVIRFLNFALGQAKERAANTEGGADESIAIDNEDVTNARDAYSRYLKSELDDEILGHWPQWEEALQACSAISTLTFGRDQFTAEYDKRRSDTNALNAAEALKMLYRFSVIGYERRSGYGGTTWAFQYTHPEAGWDNSADVFKVHLGLKEYARLREERL